MALPMWAAISLLRTGAERLLVRGRLFITGPIPGVTTPPGAQEAPQPDTLAVTTTAVASRPQPLANARASAVWAWVLVSAWVLFTVLAVVRVYCLDRAAASPEVSIAASLTFLAATTVVLIADRDRQAIVGVCGVIGSHVLYAAPCYVLAVILLRGPTERVLLPAGVAVFVAAAAEEIVFRVLLPCRLTRLAGGTSSRDGAMLIAVVFVSQLLFALCHVIPGWRPPSAALGEVLRLLEAGVLYTVVLLVLGLYASIAVHAALNFDLAYVAGPGQQRVSLGAMVSVLPLVFAAVWMARSRFARLSSSGGHT